MSPPASCCGTTPSLEMTRPANPPIRILRPLRSDTSLISLRNQPPIWAPVLPAGIAWMLNFFVEVVHQLHAAAEIHPGGLHATVETERDRGAEGESRILAEIIVRRGVAHL